MAGLVTPPGANSDKRLVEIREVVAENGRLDRAEELLRTGWTLMNIFPNQARKVDEGALVYVFGKVGRSA